jgi:hypothetical protein
MSEPLLPSSMGRVERKMLRVWRNSSGRVIISIDPYLPTPLHLRAA